MRMILIMAILAGVPSLSVAAETALTAPVSIQIHEADLAQVLAGLGKHIPIEVAEAHQAASIRVSLRVQDTPLCDVLDAVAALFGMRWQPTVGGILFRPRPRDGQPDVSRLLSCWPAITAQTWGEADQTKKVLMRRLWQVFPDEMVRGWPPGRTLAFRFFTDEQKWAALRLARRKTVETVMANLGPPAKGRLEPSAEAAFSGEGIFLHFSDKGDELTLFVTGVPTPGTLPEGFAPETKVPMGLFARRLHPAAGKP